MSMVRDPICDELCGIHQIQGQAQRGRQALDRSADRERDAERLARILHACDAARPDLDGRHDSQRALESFELRQAAGQCFGQAVGEYLVAASFVTLANGNTAM